MNMRDLINLVESYDNTNQLFSLNGEIIQSFLKDFNYLRGAKNSEIENVIFHKVAKPLWENYLYELIEENILDEDGYSINVEPEISTGIHHEDVDCYAMVSLINNQTGFYIMINNDTDVQGDSFAQQVISLLDGRQIENFKIDNELESNLTGTANAWDAIKFSITFDNLLLGKPIKTRWNIALLNKIAHSFDSQLQFDIDGAGANYVKARSNKTSQDVLNKLVQFFAQYGIKVQSSQYVNGLVWMFEKN